MDVSKILAELKAEREQIEEAILSLERLARGRGRGPGRPPNWMADVDDPEAAGPAAGEQEQSSAASRGTNRRRRRTVSESRQKGPVIPRE